MVSRWCRNEFERVLLSEPRVLEDAIDAGEISPGHLTHALEAVGKHRAPQALRLLRDGLKHPSPVVREGAIYGLAYLRPDETIDAELRAMAAADASPGVREAAADVLDDPPGWASA